MDNTRIVSFDDEPLILVDSRDHVLGYESKDKVHDGDGMLHRAFSVFIFNSHGELLMQQRHADKRLWPLIWSNSCCSHPRKGESGDAAADRRLFEELGLKTPLEYLYKFEYKARYKDLGTEHELCSVYIGATDDAPRVNATEVAEWKFMSRDELNRQLRETPERFSPWFKMEWKALQETYWPRIEALISRL
ncbi:MAG: isopentenyl-diphosphate Delta-isomerase [Calditrichaeota bacterium]|nr:MAG: isopentenyl-diphosphate Delta-isomerase [Calditrichota bacterium]